ncbi:hypothetical protein [Pararhizobium arenae]|uniref:hypothetical protein n=1 Tax=Pararhizobium arenae TaxID=1856850 RepID=UPI00094ABA2E|nr:hypothetical protein [Pararhizobium arenae]
MASRAPSLAIRTRRASEDKPKGSIQAADIRRRLELFEVKIGVTRHETSEVWDRPMEQADVFRTSPADKGKRTLVSAMRKVSLLIDMIDDQPLRALVMPDNYKDRTALRAWTDHSRKLWPWKDPVVDKPDGRYGELISLYYEALATVDAADKRKKFRLQQRIDELERIVANLEAQNFELMNQIAMLGAGVGKRDARR